MGDEYTRPESGFEPAPDLHEIEQNLADRAARLQRDDWQDWIPVLGVARVIGMDAADKDIYASGHSGAYHALNLIYQAVSTQALALGTMIGAVGLYKHLF